MRSLDWHTARLTRRQVLKGGALALAAAGAAELAGWPRLSRPAPAVSAPARCVTLGANGVINPGSSQDYRNCRTFLRETRTKWVRIWADWPSLQPEGDRAPDAGSGAWRLGELDKQIAAANADGVSVILTAYRFPNWANGTSGLIELVDGSYQLEDRADRARAATARKDLKFKLPSEVGPGSAWASWIEFLVKRYAPSSSDGTPNIAALELVNEPNTQLWPLQGPSGTQDPYDQGPVTVHEAVARMFQTAQSISTGYRSPPLLIGPGTSDATSSSRLAIRFDTFTRLLLDELDRIGFQPGRGFAWAHHNYTDVEYDQGAGSLTGRTHMGAEATRELLQGRWTGWPHADAANPVILIPEGGARLTKIASVYGPDDIRAFQARLIRRNWNRMTHHHWTAMLGQYLFYSDPNFDCGLCEIDGTKRPAFAAWASLPPAPSGL